MPRDLLSCQEGNGIVYEPDRDNLPPMKDNRQNPGLIKNIGKLLEAPIPCGPPDCIVNDREIPILALWLLTQWNLEFYHSNMDYKVIGTLAEYKSSDYGTTFVKLKDKVTLAHYLFAF